MAETKEQMQARYEAQIDELQQQLKDNELQSSDVTSLGQPSALIDQLKEQDSDWLVVPNLCDAFSVVQACPMVTTGKKSALIRDWKRKDGKFVPSSISTLPNVHAKSTGNGECVLEPTV